jgi:hypothetical protein
MTGFSDIKNSAVKVSDSGLKNLPRPENIDDIRSLLRNDKNSFPVPQLEFNKPTKPQVATDSQPTFTPSVSTENQDLRPGTPGKLNIPGEKDPLDVIYMGTSTNGDPIYEFANGAWKQNFGQFTITKSDVVNPDKTQSQAYSIKFNKGDFAGTEFTIVDGKIILNNVNTDFGPASLSYNLKNDDITLTINSGPFAGSNLKYDRSTNQFNGYSVQTSAGSANISISLAPPEKPNPGQGVHQSGHVKPNNGIGAAIGIKDPNEKITSGIGAISGIAAGLSGGKFNQQNPEYQVNVSFTDGPFKGSNFTWNQSTQSFSGSVPIDLGHGPNRVDGNLRFDQETGKWSLNAQVTVNGVPAHLKYDVSAGDGKKQDGHNNASLTIKPNGTKDEYQLNIQDGKVTSVIINVNGNRSNFTMTYGPNQNLTGSDPKVDPISFLQSTHILAGIMNPNKVSTDRPNSNQDMTSPGALSWLVSMTSDQFPNIQQVQFQFDPSGRFMGASVQYQDEHNPVPTFNVKPDKNPTSITLYNQQTGQAIEDVQASMPRITLMQLANSTQATLNYNEQTGKIQGSIQVPMQIDGEHVFLNFTYNSGSNRTPPFNGPYWSASVTDPKSGKQYQVIYSESGWYVGYNENGKFKVSLHITPEGQVQPGVSYNNGGVNAGVGINNGRPTFWLNFGYKF